MRAGPGYTGSMKSLSVPPRSRSETGLVGLVLAVEAAAEPLLAAVGPKADAGRAGIHGVHEELERPAAQPVRDRSRWPRPGCRSGRRTAPRCRRAESGCGPGRDTRGP